MNKKNHSLKGTFVGQFELLELLGEGGMGSVWYSLHPLLKTPVAIKILDGKLATSQEYIQRFILEGRLAAEIKHPHMVHVFNVNKEGDYYYIVQEYIDGSDLKVLAEERPERKLDVIEVVEVGYQIGKVLEQAYKNKIIHRDIKPENILVTRAGDLKLADLGIAKKLGDREMSLTKTGSGIGSPYYIAPEQGMDAQKADHRSDIYSLGATMYRLLTGTYPFEAETPMAMLVKHVREPLEPPLKRCPGLPENLSSVICKMMEKEPADRYQTYTKLLDDMLKIRTLKEEATLSIMMDRRDFHFETNSVKIRRPSWIKMPAEDMQPLKEVSLIEEAKPVDVRKPAKKQRLKEKEPIEDDEPSYEKKPVRVKYTDSAKAKKKMLEQENSERLKKFKLIIFPASFALITLILALSGLYLFNALTWGLVLSAATTLMVLSTMQVGSKYFYVSMGCFIMAGTLLGLLGLPDWFNKMLAGSVFIIIILYFTIVFLFENQDKDRKAIAVDTGQIKIDGKLHRKNSQKAVTLKRKDGGRNQALPDDENTIDDDCINKTPRPAYEEFRNKAVLYGMVILTIVFVFFSMTGNVRDFFKYLSVFTLVISIFLVMAPMMKPGSKAFWVILGTLSISILTVFIQDQVKANQLDREKYIYNWNHTIKINKVTGEAFTFQEETEKWSKTP